MLQLRRCIAVYLDVQRLVVGQAREPTGPSKRFIMPRHSRTAVLNSRGTSSRHVRNLLVTFIALNTIGGFKWGKGGMPPSQTWLQQVPAEATCGVSRMQENLLAAGTSPRTPLGELTAFPKLSSW